MKLYRQGTFLQLADELSARTGRGGPLSNFRLSRIVKLLDSLRVLRDELLPALERGEVVVMDRYLETHRAAATSQLKWELRRHPVACCFPRAERTFWLDLPIEQALARLFSRPGELSADEHPTGLSGYLEAYREMASEAGWVRLDARAAFSENARAIDQVLELAHVAAPPPVVEAASRPSCARLSGRVSIWIGGERGELLGGGYSELLRFVRTRIGAAAAGVPEAFWIEAYAAQVAEDLWAGTGRECRVAVWPEALAKMWVFRDLETLRELSRMIEARADVAGFSNRGSQAWFAELCPHPAAQARLLRQYRRALNDLAWARGWSSHRDSQERPRWQKNRSLHELGR